MGSGLFEASASEYPVEVFFRALLEAIMMGSVIIGLSLIREPLGMGTLSFPGGPQGIIELFSSRDPDSFAPARILSVTSGGLLLLGYVIALFRFFKERNISGPEAEQ